MPTAASPEPHTGPQLGIPDHMSEATASDP